MNRFQTIENADNECRFCGFLKSGSKKSEVDSPWMIGEQYAAFVSIGALVPGWSLIVPKEHKINLSKDYSNTYFWQFIKEAASVIENNFGRFSIFEHGAFNFDSKTSCGTGHAHLHMVPVSFSLFDEAKAFNTEMTWEKCLVSEVAEKSKNSEYLFVADSFEGALTQGHICLLKNETSQFFRKVIATKLGIPEKFDYKTSKMLDVSMESIEKLSGYVWSASNKSRSA
jgi:diadenosine tetraphosphate (Ap4A) HIT family hydrolase